MIEESICIKRRCKHFMGMIELDGTEASERAVCEAFPKGIPFEIAYGSNLHSEPLKDQGNNIIYEELQLEEREDYINRLVAFPRPGRNT